MFDLEFLLIIIASYLTGAFPTSFLLGKLFYNIDIRNFGSGNAGATNTFRVLGRKSGVVVLLIDILKGYVVAKYIYFFEFINLLEIVNTDLFFQYQLLFGLAAIIGHIFPVYINFKGGKGIATILGILISLNLTAALYSCVVFLVILFLTKYVSLSSIIACFFYSIFILFIYESNIQSEKIFSIFVLFLSLITHRKNISRLIKKEETKVKFGT
tara:strand:- start:3007 stop:3645 length:639 start_codon:yes stop_codon:yes gene_type:complete